MRKKFSRCSFSSFIKQESSREERERETFLLSLLLFLKARIQKKEKKTFIIVLLRYCTARESLIRYEDDENKNENKE